MLNRPYYRPYRSHYRPYHSSYRPYYRTYDTGYYNAGYRTASYHDGYSSYGCQRRTVYVPYGWTWYRTRDTNCW